MRGDDDEHTIKMVRTFDLPLDVWQKIKAYQHGNAMPSRIAAVRQMLTEAYDAWVARTNAR